MFAFKICSNFDETEQCCWISETNKLYGCYQSPLKRYRPDELRARLGAGQKVALVSWWPCQTRHFDRLCANGQLYSTGRGKRGETATKNIGRSCSYAVYSYSHTSLLTVATVAYHFIWNFVIFLCKSDMLSIVQIVPGVSILVPFFNIASSGIRRPKSLPKVD